ncbi:MAG: coproporphyrinogen dehydrogenase HemZ, partial [Oscillospiraceae bacterium]|nr:coproporphyrinogen dehydrogenase HemZ [Oscillospiraceae bacterium]
MRLCLIGHDKRYAVEQIMLALFPKERPIYAEDQTICSPPGAIEHHAINAPPGAIEHHAINAPPGAIEDQTLNAPMPRSNLPVFSEYSAESRLAFGKKYAQSTTIISNGSMTSRGVSRVSISSLTDKLTSDRLLQRIIKQSFYNAASRFVATPPVWGSLTGIRPARLASALLTSGKTETSAVKTLIKEYHVSAERAGLCVEAAHSAAIVSRSLAASDVALYVGIPFCPSRCAYCSFVSNDVEKSFNLVNPFTAALIGEISAMARLVEELKLRIIAIYVGGGTPTALPPESFLSVMNALCSSFDLSDAREFTIEAGRPETITAQYLDIMHACGARRVCVNPQTMSQDVLNAIGRKHTPEDVISAVELVRKYGMELNMDVIAGLPGDTSDTFARTLDILLGLAPESITVHTLSNKKGSRIMLEDAHRPSGIEVASMLDYASRSLRISGYSPYYLYRQKFTSGGFENTGWCLPGHESVYNICMMEELCTVLALGGGGVTKLVRSDATANDLATTPAAPAAHAAPTASAAPAAPAAP